MEKEKKESLIEYRLFNSDLFTLNKIIRSLKE